MRYQKVRVVQELTRETDLYLELPDGSDPLLLPSAEQVASALHETVTAEEWEDAELQHTFAESCEEVSATEARQYKVYSLT